MRKVDFTGWNNIQRFAKYAKDHLQVAKTASEQLDYWESLYDLIRHDHSPQGVKETLTKKQQTELASFQEEIRRLPQSERYALAKSIEYRHRETLDLLKKMSKEGILAPEDFAEPQSLSSSHPPLTTKRRMWAVAYDRDKKPVIEGGQLKLYPTKPPTIGETLRRALHEASQLRAENGVSGKIAFFLAYTCRSALKQIQGRPYANSLTDKEARSIQATNEMINFLQKEWNSNTQSNMKTTPSKTQTVPQTASPSPMDSSRVETTNLKSIPSPAMPTPGPSIVNNITIQGAMNGDIGFQRNEIPSPSNPSETSFPNTYPQRTGNQSQPDRKLSVTERQR